MKLTTFQQHTSRDFLICFGRFFSSDWRQCAVPGVVIKNLFLSASSLLAQAMLEVLISAPIICLSVCLSLPLSLCVYFSMHPQTITNTESMLLRHQSNTSSFFILETPPPSFKPFQNRNSQKIKSLYKKQQQLLNACLTESNPTPKKEPSPQEKPKQNKHPAIPELTLFLSNNSLHCCCYKQ
jgi:hypothetical protein